MGSRTRKQGSCLTGAALQAQCRHQPAACWLWGGTGGIGAVNPASGDLSLIAMIHLSQQLGHDKEMFWAVCGVAGWVGACTAALFCLLCSSCTGAKRAYIATSTTPVGNVCRAMRLLNAAGVVRQLDPAATPSAANTPAGSPSWKQQQNGVSPHKAAAGDAGFPSALIHTPSRQADKQQVQQQLPLTTPRGRGKSNREAELLGADIK